ncbi:ribosome recycling factor [Candidatus Gracilibacteria bacterium]|nr:ribosome recycling factor [Candidatus Gracilibacteria bacterium]
MINDVIKDFEGKLKKSIEALRHNLSGIRTGRASPALVEHLPIEAYGSSMPLNQLAGISVPEARLLVIQPYDAAMIKAIEKAIQNSELGINPSNDGRVIRLGIPQLTEDRRKQLVKQVHSRVEEAKVAIRNQRRDANEDLKQLLNEKLISEDDQRRAQERIQQITDKSTKEIEQIGSDKEAEVLEV